MDERRRNPRRRTLKSGKIIVGNTRSVIDCTVRNLTPDGALLLVPNLLGIPARFELELGQARHDCRVIWRGEDRLGVEFAA